LTFKRAYAYATLAIRHVAWHMFKPISFNVFKKSGFTTASWYTLKVIVLRFVTIELKSIYHAHT